MVNTGLIIGTEEPYNDTSFPDNNNQTMLNNTQIASKD
jgi:hypothetical protein